MIKFMQYFVKNTVTGKKVKVSYHKSEDLDGSQYIAIYDDGYGQDLFDLFDGYFNESMSGKNDSDSMTDYFCKTDIKIKPGHELYQAACLREGENRFKFFMKLYKQNPSDEMKKRLLELQDEMKALGVKVKSLPALTLEQKLASMPMPTGINCLFGGVV
ncbi:MAG: hypothetical protein DRN14_05900 [Thermoplasmata archaeon]|nr:MAG: hypothetical protein DRN14_05900 [Thermoplasmata archaeon]